MKQNALFISQDIFLNESMMPGGVKLCTSDFIALISTRFNLISFPLKTNLNMMNRLFNKLGLIGYHPFELSFRQLVDVEKILEDKEVKYIFINHTYISSIVISLKKSFPDVKIVMCSHGNESGDFLHLLTRFPKNMSWVARFFGSRKLGTMLMQEVEFRRDYFDAVLTVSEVEESIEKWLGAKNVKFVPRVFTNKFIEIAPINQRVGFVSDISHEPNYFSILKFCEFVDNSSLKEIIHVRLVGKEHWRFTYLSNKFSFVECTGYLSEAEIVSELATWHYYLNLVGYFSKGVSTKLAYGMNFGLPVISTQIGVRGYFFPHNTGPTILKDIEEVVQYLTLNINNIDNMDLCKNKVRKAVLDFSDLSLVGYILADIH
jgi:hypothetical protein